MGIGDPARPAATAASKSRAKTGKPAAIDTRQATYELLNKGLTVAQVAREQALGESYTYGEIRPVQAHRKYLAARDAVEKPPA